MDGVAYDSQKRHVLEFSPLGGIFYYPGGGKLEIRRIGGAKR